MKVDWDELKRLHEAAAKDEALADEVFLAVMIDNFHAILAEREAAQRLSATIKIGPADRIDAAMRDFDRRTE